MILNKENTFTEQNRFLVYSDQLNATRKQILDTAEEMISRSAIQTFEDEGETITATDSSYLASLTVDGKAVQDGTPTPNNPVPIQIVGLNDDNEFGIQIGETLYSIDLQGNVLASLPDGTKDVLTVDSAGHVVLEKRVGKYDVGTLNWTDASSPSTHVFRTNLYGQMSDSDYPVIPNGNSLPNAMMRKYARDTWAHISGSSNGCFAIGIQSATNQRLVIVDHNYSDSSLFAASLNGELLYYELVTPQTIDLGYIDMPAIPDGSQISITAQVTPTIAAKWWTKNQSDVAAAFGAVSSNLATLQDEISALDARVTALEDSNAKMLVLEKLETSKEVQREDVAADEQEEMNLDDAE